MSLFKCLICPDFSTFTLYKHYVLEHFHLEAFKDLQKFFPNGYQDCSKCVSDYAHSTLKDAIIHIGVSHKRVDVYLKKYLKLRKNYILINDKISKQKKSREDTPKTIKSGFGENPKNPTENPKNIADQTTDEDMDLATDLAKNEIQVEIDTNKKSVDETPHMINKISNSLGIKSDKYNDQIIITDNPRNITAQNVQISDEGIDVANSLKVQEDSKTKVQIKINGDKVFGIWISKSPNCVNLDDIKKHLLSQPRKYGISANNLYEYSVKTVENIIEEIHEDESENILPFCHGKIILECWQKSC